MNKTWRRITRDEAKALKVGDRVAIRYFDPNGPRRDPETKMTTDTATVLRILGDPCSHLERTVLLHIDDATSLRRLTYFGTDLHVEA